MEIYLFSCFLKTKEVVTPLHNMVYICFPVLPRNYKRRRYFCRKIIQTNLGKAICRLILDGSLASR